MLDRHDLSPTSPDWLKNWESILGNDTLIHLDRPLTRRAIMDALQAVYNTVKDMATYRRPLGDLVYNFCRSTDGGGDRGDDADVMWKMLGEEVVLRVVEQEDSDGATNPSSFLDLLFAVALSKDPKPDSEEVQSPDTASIYTTETQSTSREKEKDPALSSMRSLLSSLATGGTSSRSQSIQPQSDDAKRNMESPPPSSSFYEASAVSALVEILCQLTFTPFVLEEKNLKLAIQVYEMLIDIISKSRSTRAKLTALQFLMRLRADRDHKLYFISAGYDRSGLIYSLGSLINKAGEPESVTAMSRGSDDTVLDNPDVRRARPRFPQERGRPEFSRGHGSGGPSDSAPSRSGSRTTAPTVTPTPKPLDSLWHLPESLTFYVPVDSPSEVLVSYDSGGSYPSLPISRYLQAVIGLLQRETSWEVLSYVICHLPVQLSNKHLFCGPQCRSEISKLHSVLCSGIHGGNFAASVEQWPAGLKIRDAHGLAYHTLSVLLSYQRCFDSPQRHLLVEVFQAGLNGQLSTIKCCLHALSLAAFELPSSMTKYLSRILEKLSQIMSNPSMAVHILGFLSIVGSLPALYANFTEADFKMVFGVALQYLQHYNSLNVTETMSWALSQHVRILSYSVVYIWFLAIKLPDRPPHVRYITRQLLLANEGNAQVDEPTEVCFDWLSRYTYASADPRPAGSTFSDIVLTPTASNSEVKEKTWIFGYSVITVRALTRSGWVEIMSRRPSGFSRFVCRVENVPMVGPGDVVPDLLSIPASLIMEREPSCFMTKIDGSPIITNKVRDLTDI
jgi:tuberous sclerosis 2